MTTEAAPVDIWRDSLVRYLGYSNELGESFRPIVPRLVVPSYAVAFGYVLGDTYDKATRAQHAAAAEGVSPRKRNALVANATLDTLLWQTLVSRTGGLGPHACTVLMRGLLR
jgi:mitochondrial fission process protein 1